MDARMASVSAQMIRDNGAWLADLSASDERRGTAERDLRATLVAFLRRRFAAVAGDHVEDFAQEALARVLAQRSLFRGDCQFVTWALAIAARVATSELRRARWKDESLDAIVARRGEPFPAPPHDVERQLARRRILDALGAAVLELTAQQRLVITAELRGVPQDAIPSASG